MKARRFQAVIRIPAGSSSKSARVRLRTAQDWFDRSIEVRDAAVAYVTLHAEMVKRIDREGRWQSLQPRVCAAWDEVLRSVKAYQQLTKPKKRK